MSAEEKRKLSEFSTEELVEEITRRKTHAEETLRLIKGGKPKILPPAVDDARVVIEACEDFFGVPSATIIGTSRMASIVKARHTAMYLLSVWSNMGSSAVAEIFQCDHATVCHAVAKISDGIERDMRLQGQVDDLKRRISKDISNAAPN